MSNREINRRLAAFEDAKALAAEDAWVDLPLAEAQQFWNEYIERADAVLEALDSANAKGKDSRKPYMRGVGELKARAEQIVAELV